MNLRTEISVAALSLAAVLTCQCLTGTAVCAILPKTKEDFINDILEQLKSSYSVDPLLAGKTFRVDIKDFSPDDEETYAVVQGLDDFWIIVLPIETKKLYGLEHELCVCRSHKLQFVRKELVEMTLKDSLVRQFTVPKANK